MTRAGLLIVGAACATAASWFVATSDERALAADHHRRAAAIRDARYLAEQNAMAAEQRLCDRGFVAASGRLTAITPTYWTRRLSGVTQVFFRTAAEREALAREIKVPTASRVSQVVIEISSCSKLRSRLPQVSAGRLLYVDGKPSRFGLATGYADVPMAEATDVDDDWFFPRWRSFIYTRESGRVPFYAPAHRSFVTIDRTRLSLRGGGLTYADWTGIGLGIERLGRALTMEISIFVDPRETYGTLLLADRIVGEMAPWLDQLDAVAVAEATRERNNRTPSG